MSLEDALQARAPYKKAGCEESSKRWGLYSKVLSVWNLYSIIG